MALKASVAVLSTESHDAIETRAKLDVLSDIDEEDDVDDVELRSVSSYRSQKSLPKSISNNNMPDLLTTPSKQNSFSDLSQQHEQQHLSQPSLEGISQEQDKRHQTQPTPQSQHLENVQGTIQSASTAVSAAGTKTVSFSEAELPEYLPPTNNLTLRQHVFKILENPKSSKLAFIVSVILLSVVFLSTVTFLIGSLPQFWTHPPEELFVIEAFCVSVFLVEYLAKILTCPYWKKWVVSPLAIIDLLAIIPFFLEFGITSNLGSIAVIRVIRLVRIFRIFKLGKFSITTTIVGRTILKAREGILLLVFLVVLSLLIFSSALFYAEQAGQTFDEKAQKWVRDDGTESPFQSIPETFWWCAVTLTTTGYGDQFPVSWPGRAIAILTMLCGILVIAFPVTIINTHFQDTWEEVRSAQRQKKEERKYSKKGVQTLDRTVKLLLKRNYLMLEQMAEMNHQLQRYQYEITQMNNMLQSLQSQIPKSQIGVIISTSPTITITDTDSVSLTTTT